MKLQLWLVVKHKSACDWPCIVVKSCSKCSLKALQVDVAIADLHVSVCPLWSVFVSLMCLCGHFACFLKLLINCCLCFHKDPLESSFLLRYIVA